MVSALKNSPGVYVGGSDAMVPTVYRWADTFEKVTNLPWSPGQSTNSERKDCLGFHKDGNTGFRYHDFICTDKLDFICEMERGIKFYTKHFQSVHM